MNDRNFKNFRIMMRGGILSGVIVCLALAAQAGTTWHVTVDGNDANNGLSWPTAFATINHAFNQSSGGDTVMISNGVYQMTAAAQIWKDLTIESVNGSAYTFVDGGAAPGGFSTIEDYTMTMRGLTFTNFQNTIVINPWGGNLYLYDLVIRGAPGAGQRAMNLGGGARTFMYDCVLTGHEVNGHGAAIQLYAGAPLYIYDSHISSNKATGGRRGGAIYMLDGGSELVLERCTFIGNTAPDSSTGGAIANLFNGNLTVRDSVFSGNEARNGGAITSSGANVLISNSRFTDNSCRRDGGGLFFKDGIIENSLVAGNHADRLGGGIHLDSSQTVMRNCTVVNNTADTQWGGVSGGTIVNSIIYNNISGWQANYGGLSSITHSITDPDPGGDNIVADPVLDEEFKPQRGSPAINAGLYQEWMDDATDLAGNPRILQGAVDIGAYEYVPASTLFLIR